MYKLHEANNSTNIGIENAIFSRYCFYMNTNISEDFQICITAPFMKICGVTTGGVSIYFYVCVYVCVICM